MKDLPFISVIIPTVDGDKHIEKSIKAVENSTYKNVELIVVNEGLERSAQRNIGAKRAKGEVLVFLDSDQYVTPYLLEEIAFRYFSKHDNYKLMFYIPEKIITKGWFAKLRNWERQFYTGTAVDCIRVLESIYFQKFDESLNGPEDTSFDRYYMDEYKEVTKRYLYHEDDIGVMDYFKKKSYYAKSMKRFNEKHPDDKITNFWWRCFGVYLEKGKWVRCICAPHLFFLVMLMNFIRGIIYLKER